MFTNTLPKGMFVSEGFRTMVWITVAVPLSVTGAACVAALLGRETLPEYEPAVAGANAIETLADWPAVRFSGKVAPPEVNPVPVTVAEFTVSVPVPVLLIVIVFTVEVPVFTLPKSSEAGDTLMIGLGGVVPVPLAVMVVGELVALLAIEIVAESAAALCGENVIVAVAVAPGAIVEPLAIPLTE